MKTVIYTTERKLKRPAHLIGEMLTDISNSWGLALRLAIRNISALYRQTALGYVWAFLPPIFAAVTFIILRGGGALNVSANIEPYVPWVMTGTFFWQMFADALVAPIKQVSQAKPMLAKINFPRESLILAGLMETGFNFCIRLVILLPVLFLYGITPGFEILLLPLFLIVLMLMGNVIGLLVTPISVLYQDVGKGIPLMLPFLMILSGAVVPIPDTGLGHWLSTLNPIYPVLDIARSAMLGKPLLYGTETAVIAVGTLILLAVSWILFRVSMPHLIARISN